MRETFENIVGQDAAKKKLNFFLELRGYRYRTPPYVRCPKGCGKTTMAKAFGKQLLARHDEAHWSPKRF